MQGTLRNAAIKVQIQTCDEIRRIKLGMRRRECTINRRRRKKRNGTTLYINKIHSYPFEMTHIKRERIHYVTDTRPCKKKKILSKRLVECLCVCVCVYLYLANMYSRNNFLWSTSFAKHQLELSLVFFFFFRGSQLKCHPYQVQ